MATNNGLRSGIEKRFNELGSITYISAATKSELKKQHSQLTFYRLLAITLLVSLIAFLATGEWHYGPDDDWQMSFSLVALVQEFWVELFLAALLALIVSTLQTVTVQVVGAKGLAEVDVNRQGAIKKQKLFLFDKSTTVTETIQRRGFINSTKYEWHTPGKRGGTSFSLQDDEFSGGQEFFQAAAASWNRFVKQPACTEEIERMDLHAAIKHYQLSFGLTQSQVKELLGEPSSVDDIEYGESWKLICWSYEAKGLELVFDSDENYQLSKITLFSPQVEFKGTAVIGLSEKALLKAFPNLKLEDEKDEFGYSYELPEENLLIWISEGVVENISVYR